MITFTIIVFFLWPVVVMSIYHSTRKRAKEVDETAFVKYRDVTTCAECGALMYIQHSHSVKVLSDPVGFYYGEPHYKYFCRAHKPEHTEESNGKKYKVSRELVS